MKTDYRSSHKSEKISRVYDDVLYKTGTYDDALWQKEKRILHNELLRIKERGTALWLLDFACGTGRILSFLEEYADKAVGVDISEEMLMRARQIVRRARLVRADLTRDGALAGEVFTFITAFRFFLNAEPALREEAMAALAAKLQNGGSILVFNIHGNLWSHRLLTKIWLMVRKKHLSYATRRESVGLARRHGLSVIRWYGIGIIPKVAYRMLGSALAAKIDRMLERIPGMRYVAYDLVFVCKKGIVER